MQTLMAYLRLTRPANILTAIADILLGYAISGSFISIYEWHNFTQLLWLILATSGLYAGGVVLNDVFDYEVDKVERPERPLPSGRASLNGARILGVVLLLLGFLAAYQVSGRSANLAFTLVILILLYDSITKQFDFTGPFTMGLCRGFNLLLGMSVVPMALSAWWGMAVIPLIYIFAITLVSRGEVNGGNPFAIRGAFVLYFLVIGLIISLAWLGEGFKIWYALPLLFLFAFLIFPPLLAAAKNLAAQQVMRAVKAGVLALIVLDAAIASGFAGIIYGLIVLALLPISILLAKAFAVS
jgi:4-hydroxybenzoate polyprenyltransferase